MDGDALSYRVVRPPDHGRLEGDPPRLTYRPAADFHGSDSFVFAVSDGSAEPALATVSLSVAPMNDVPVAVGQGLSVGQEPGPLTLTATDADGEALTYRIEQAPTEGTLSGTPPELVYTPPPGFHGTTTFTFTASDGKATSAPSTVTLHVTNGAPQVAISASTARPQEGEAVHFTARAEDPGGDSLTYLWRFGDGATSEEANPTHAYANEGAYEVVLTVSDGVESVQATLSLEVLNAAPVLVPLAVPAASEEGKLLTFRASASDSGASDALTYTWDFGDDSQPTEGREVTHAYADDGTYTVTVTVRDDAGAATHASREVQVSNLVPVSETVPEQHVAAGQELRVELRASDVAGERDPLTWELVEGPGALTPEGLYSWTPAPSDGGAHLVRARVSDDEGGSGEVLFRIVAIRDAEGGGGCGCNGTGETASPVFLLLLALAGLSRRPGFRS